MSVFDDVKAIEELSGAGDAEQARGDHIANAGRAACADAYRLKASVEKGELTIEDAGQRARTLLGALQDAVCLSAPEQPPPLKPVRKTRADAGKARGPREKAPVQTEIHSTSKPRASDDRKSPLTPEIRAKLEATLTNGPLQFPEIMKMSWTALYSEAQVEGFLCEDPTAFVRWNPEEFGGLEAWGTVADFDRAVSKLKIPGIPIDGRPKYTAEALGCSIGAAADAWKRLDPRQA